MRILVVAGTLALMFATPCRAQAQAFVYVVPGYRPAPPPVAVAYRPTPLQLQSRAALGLRIDVTSINQTIAGEDNVMAGGGLVFRYRHSLHWGLEAAVDREEGRFGEGRFQRSSTPLAISLLCHLTPRGIFDLHLVGGLGWVFSEVRIENPPGRPDLDEVRQSFGEFQAHFGLGGELRIGRHFGIVSDLRYVGRVLNTDNKDGRWYKDVSDGVIPSSSNGVQFTLGVLAHF
jgi:hypothetical protein